MINSPVPVPLLDSYAKSMVNVVPMGARCGKIAKDLNLASPLSFTKIEDKV